jgi:uncharacterized protein (DUF58 family)
MYKMFKNKRWAFVLTALLLLSVFLAACQAGETVVEVTRVITETVEVEGQVVEVTRVVTETEEVVVTVEVPTEVEVARTRAGSSRPQRRLAGYDRHRTGA